VCLVEQLGDVAPATRIPRGRLRILSTAAWKGAEKQEAAWLFSVQQGQVPWTGMTKATERGGLPSC
jgi:hypothetical protein